MEKYCMIQVMYCLSISTLLEVTCNEKLQGKYIIIFQWSELYLSSERKTSQTDYSLLAIYLCAALCVNCGCS